MRKVFAIILCLCVIGIQAQQRFDGYYSSVDGKKKEALKAALHSAIQPKYVLPYGSNAGKTWSGFYRTDRMKDNQVVDRYSNDKRYFPANATAATASVVSGMNIEHSFPKSWWGGTENNAYKDLYNLMPSEAKINSAKSNYAMGVVTNDKSGNGCTKVGAGSAGGTSATLWEPADKWKGDFARDYMYMATCYSNFTWVQEGTKMLDKNDYPTFKKWAYELLLKWSREDPVDEIEVARNDSVYKIQRNRNPFVDFPNLCEYVWGDSVDFAFDVNKTFMATSGHLPDADPDHDDDPSGVFSVTPTSIAFKALPGQPSEYKEIKVYTKDLQDPTVSIMAEEPFEVSSDKQTWQQTLQTKSTYFSFYARFAGSSEEREFVDEISVANNEKGDRLIDVSCVVSSGTDFLEDFETGSKSAYASASVKCNACSWTMNNALIGTSASDRKNGKAAPRIKAGGTLTMESDYDGGCSQLTFYAGKYGNDVCTLSVSYSTDQGANWTDIDTGITMGELQQYTYKLNVSKPVRLRFTSAGNRSNVDDIVILPYSSGESSVTNVVISKHADNVAYDLSGRRTTPRKGRIYIQGGKKILR